MSDFIKQHFSKIVKPYGRFVMVHSRKGERLYFFMKNGSVSLVPAELVDPNYAKIQKDSRNATLHTD